METRQEVEGRNRWFNVALDLMKTTSCSGHIFSNFAKPFPSSFLLFCSECSSSGCVLTHFFFCTCLVKHKAVQCLLGNVFFMDLQILLCIGTCPKGFTLVSKQGFLMCSSLQIALDGLAGRLSQLTSVASLTFLAIICFIWVCSLSQMQHRSTEQPRAREGTLHFLSKAVFGDHKSSHNLMQFFG